LQDVFLTRRDLFVTLAALDPDTLSSKNGNRRTYPLPGSTSGNPRTEIAMAKTKSLKVNLKPIKQDIEKTIKKLRGFKSKVSAADKTAIDLKIGYLNDAIKDLKQSCKNAKMTPGFAPE
jgi:hypothetical protein